MKEAINRETIFDSVIVLGWAQVGIYVWEHSWSLKIVIANFHITKRDYIWNLVSLGRLNCLFAILCNFASCRMDFWVPTLGLKGFQPLVWKTLILSSVLLKLETASFKILCLSFAWNSFLPSGRLQQLSLWCAIKDVTLIAVRHGFEAEGQTDTWENSLPLGILCKIITASFVVLTGSCCGYCVLDWTLCC